MTTERREQVKEAQAAYKRRMQEAGYVQRTIWVNSDDRANLTIIKYFLEDRADLKDFLDDLNKRLGFAGRPGRPGRPKKPKN